MCVCVCVCVCVCCNYFLNKIAGNIYVYVYLTIFFQHYLFS